MSRVPKCKLSGCRRLAGVPGGRDRAGSQPGTVVRLAQSAGQTEGAARMRERRSLLGAGGCRPARQAEAGAEDGDEVAGGWVLGRGSPIVMRACVVSCCECTIQSCCWAVFYFSGPSLYAWVYRPGQNPRVGRGPPWPPCSSAPD